MNKIRMIFFLDESGVKKENEDVHVPAANLAALRKQEELREKMAQIREKRKINQKLGWVPSLVHNL